jgi:hypothetical protein
MSTAREQSRQFIIRFASSSIPDLPLTISTNLNTTPIISLNLFIRPHLLASASNSRLSLINAGKLLRPTDPLSILLYPPVVQNSLNEKAPAHEAPIYIHCSLRNPLSPTSLERERAEVEAAQNALLSQSSLTHVRHTNHDRDNIGSIRNGIAPAPLGFDRFLSQGWSADDIEDLRSAFVARLAYTHPLPLPSGHTLQALEDVWLDSTHLRDESTPENEWVIDDEEDEARALDDRLIGSMVGFFWPVAGWMAIRREAGGEGWSERRMLGVILGVLINLLFGTLRALSVRMEDV